MNDNKPNDPFDELMRRSLHEEADRIEPSDALPEIRARAHAQRPAARRPWLLTAGLAAAGTAAAIGAFTMLNGPDNIADDGDAVAGPGTTTTATGVPESQTPSIASATPEPSQAPTEPPTTSPSAKTAGPTDRGVPEPAVKSTVVPVYWLGQQVGAPKKSAARLYRTWAKVSGRPAEQAVRIMTTKQPSDPDYYSVWRGAALNTVTRSNGIVTVDFKQLPTTALDADLARVAAQQLVYTVQGALGDNRTPIQVTEAGRSGRRLFGQVDTSGPLSRAQAADVQALVWIDSPAEDQLVKSKVTVQGVASAFEATVNYEATNLKTRETKKSFTSAKEGQKFSPYSFQLTLTPGEWQISVYLLSAEDGSITNTDSKSVVVK
ncbi:sporulation and spore germination protein [Kribbella sp. VKM Ac-2569]|uniref:Gmad2 immunoglobulin-like domain-containing protein n=1 Tax=Kribbella sp. VKM Ac-2569 TaxID=2512220 RepID=UPI00102CD664|nr:Gmad2 immunoglobulin-like domain-containing protein [Kribbella sp. VKM Ac-2569]RZT27201.1 sporulation and spore germination protein [Kribbella sp. VKM Ac-2569]